MIDLRFWAERLIWLFRLQFVLALAIFTYFTLSPEPGLNASSNDKLWHFLGNMVFFLSARLALLRWRNLWFVPLFVLCYGAAMELVQNLVPQRSFDPGDLVANALGVLAGWIIALVAQWALGRLGGVRPEGDRGQP